MLVVYAKDCKQVILSCWALVEYIWYVLSEQNTGFESLLFIAALVMFVN